MSKAKKHRNRERNQLKAEARRVRVDTQNRTHDAALFADGFVRSVEKKRTPEGPSPEEYPYTTMNVAKSLQNYVKIDPKYIYIRLESAVDKADDGTPTLKVSSVMYANKPEGPVELGRSSQTYPSKTIARNRTLPELAVVPLLNDEGKFEYPFYDEAKGRILGEARAKRERRIRNAAKSMGVEIGGQHGPD